MNKKKKIYEHNYEQTKILLGQKEKAFFEKEKEFQEKEKTHLKTENELLEKEKEFREKLEKLEREKKEFEQKLNDIINELNDLKSEKIPILVGLNNIGATCYMNATLQCLSNTSELTKYFLKEYKYNESDKDKIMSNEYYKVIYNLWNRQNNNKSYSPDSFKNILSQENDLFAGVAANDSKDLINFLLERFHKELNKGENDNLKINNYTISQNDQLYEDRVLQAFLTDFKRRYNSVISNLFYGLLETKSHCQGCGNIKFNFQIYSFIEFPLEQVNNYCFNNGKRNNASINNINKNPDIELYECFEYYGRTDMMIGDNQMFCNICNCLCNAFYITNLYSAPNYLIINLNRGKGAVYECNVNFPEQLNLFNYVFFKNGNTVFELYAVICHFGPSSMSGHFIAYCKNRIDKKWYKYNDAIVSLCEKNDEYKNGMPYILFYQVK